ncbi:DUF6214 family protein [Streptomyces sp. PT12]|uniref:DUF6214 family protein n=1 Tax=Streptomyces sp. PT12 TaxID=1510197 RepID=UPI0011BE950F|nr:DUF6214 family protein [Streptomyces sp. PT12]
MAKSSFSGFPGGRQPDGPTPDEPTRTPVRWEPRGHGSASAPDDAGGGLPPWFSVGLVLADGARLDVLAQVSEGRLLIEDMRADPPLPVEGLGALTERIAEPLRDACRALTGRYGTALAEPATHGAPHEPHESHRSYEPYEPYEPHEPRPEPAASGPEPQEPSPPPKGERPRHGATPLRRGARDRRRAADAYLAARKDGRDPVLAVMAVTGRGRRRALRLIAAARDKGLLPPRHARR